MVGIVPGRAASKKETLELIGVVEMSKQLASLNIFVLESILAWISSPILTFSSSRTLVP